MSQGLPLRVGIGAVGVIVGGYGLFRLLERGLSNLWSTVLWLAGGVLAHDALLAPLTIAVCAVGFLAVPKTWRAAAAAGLLVLGTVTVTAIPVLGRFGARADNATLLDRSYWAGWFVLLGLVLLGVLVTGFVHRRRTPGQDD